jgi:transketolase
VTAEEHSIIGGLGGAVAEFVVRTRPVPVERVGIADTFTESGPYADLLQKYGMSAESIVEAVHRVMARKSALA